MSCMNKYIADADFSDTGFSYTMSLISGKHKMVILYCLMEFEPVRFNELQRRMPEEMTHTTLSRQLKTLEVEGLIVRTEYQQIPPRVEYSLSEIGQNFKSVLSALEAWGNEYIQYMKDREK